MRERVKMAEDFMIPAFGSSYCRIVVGWMQCRAGMVKPIYLAFEDNEDNFQLEVEWVSVGQDGRRSKPTGSILYLRDFDKLQIKFRSNPGTNNRE